ncbi:DUF1150 domain-containing protein [Siccirubricoccus sp. KC 17139]|uniref:DUF1150 domain-containing protein n=1 Tax=Siccirubricoccus soli TaxID=2899147 RepID=A0ABT1D4G1_9PROT|nr:DUF1150 family protein [Siccirubricoccus soli]MCO6416814.1 DUF1150 domain-containing protein [Siccirubricoccus soli]MCP2682949.1 DUF1150 domain-containing protein [Siccirubricoccus soli]
MNRNNSTDGTSAPAGAAVSLKQLSLADWARFGTGEIAYLRPVVVNGVHAVAIHGADGQPIGAAPNAELAVAAILQHEMAPAFLH